MSATIKLSPTKKPEKEDFSLQVSETIQLQLEAGEDLGKKEKEVIDIDKIRQNLFHDYNGKINKIAFVNKTGNYSCGAETEGKQLPWYIILPKGQFRLYWNIVNFCFSIFMLLVIPVDIAFNLECVSIADNGVFFQVCYQTIGVIQMIDLILNCFTAQMDNQGEYVTRVNTIIMMYLKSEFLRDFLVSVPWCSIVSFDMSFCYQPGLAPKKVYYYFYLFNGLKLTRGLEILDSLLSNYATQFKFVKILCILLYFTNFIGQTFTGISPTVYNLIRNSCSDELCVKNLYTKQFGNLYFYAWYYGMIFLSGNELDTNTNWEKLFLLAINLLSMCIAASIFGSIAVMIEGMGSNLSPILQKKLDVMNEYMRFKEFETGFFVVIEDYLNNLWMKQRNIIYEETFFDDMSASLHKLLLIEQWQRNYFISSKFVSLVSIDFFTNMIPMLKPKIFMNKDIIIAEGDISSDVFFNSKNGFCSLQIGGNLVKFLGPWEYFGEIAIFLRMKRRTGTITCLKNSDFLMIDSKHFEELLMDFPDDMEKISNKAKDDLMSSMKLYPSSLFAKLVPTNAKKDYLTRKCMYLSEKEEEQLFHGGKTDLKVNLNHYKNNLDQIENLIVEMKSKLQKKKIDMDNENAI